MDVLNTLFLIVDFETRGAVDLRGKNSVGLHNYATHPETEALMLGYALTTLREKPSPSLWRIWSREQMPTDLASGLANPNIPIAAWNSQFERYIFLYKLGVMLPIERFQDPQASSRYLSLTGDLKDDGRALWLPPDLAKEHKGEEYIKLFSMLTRVKESKKKGTPAQAYFRDCVTDTEAWEGFEDYCKQDVVAEWEMMRREALVQAFPLPERERRIWVFDQRVNDRGIPVDIEFVQKALDLAIRAKQQALRRISELTGVENPNSIPKMLAWFQSQGYPEDSLDKDFVTPVLKKQRDLLTPLCIKVLEARKAAASTTYQKLAAILRQVSPDGRLRNQFIYMGSSRCGRWSGNAVQLHNMARPEELFEDRKIMDRARALIMASDYDGIIREFGKKSEDPNEPPDYGAVLLVVKNTIRTVFVAK
jgi:DNA polymerase bacteriophage-type